MASTGVKIVSALIVIKLMASELGPEGFGLLGQLMTVVAIAAMLAGGGITNGVIKSLASTPLTTIEGRSWMSTAFTLTTVISIAVGFVLVGLAQPLSGLLLKGEYAYLFFCLALAQAVIAYGNIIQAEASSRCDSAFYAKVNVIGTVLATCVFIIFVMTFGFEGAAFGVIMTSALPSVIALHHTVRNRRELLYGCRWHVDRSQIRHLLSYSMVTVIGATSIPVAQLIVRELFGEKYGWNEVGFWQGVVKMSDVYMQFVGVILINHAMPRFAAAIDIDSALVELRKVLVFLLITVSAGLAAIYVSRIWAIQLVFSDAFLPMSDFLPAQFGGDVFRMIAASISFFLMGRGYVALSIAYEFLQGPTFIALFLLLQDCAGTYGPVYAHMASNATLAAIMGLTLLILTRRSAQ